MSGRSAIPQWLVERLLAGDLPADQAAEVRQALESEQGVARLDALRDDDRACVLALPPAQVAQEVHRRAGTSAGRPPRAVSPFQVLAPLAVAGLAVVLWVRGTEQVAPVVEHGGDQTREKGLAAHLTVYRLGPEGPRPLKPGTRLRHGDALQVAYVAPGGVQGAIFSLDGRGEVTRHFPEAGSMSVRLEAQGESLLPHAYQLDDAPRLERFFLVTSGRPFSLAEVESALRKLPEGAREAGRPQLPPGIDQTSYSFRKDSP